MTIDPKKIEQWAREAIVFADTKRDWRKDGSWSEAFNEHFSHLAYNAGRAAALEEAKAACLAQANEPECPERAQYCADEIERLKQITPKEPS